MRETSARRDEQTLIGGDAHDRLRDYRAVEIPEKRDGGVSSVGVR
jgi:hypothetical protein